MKTKYSQFALTAAFVLGSALFFTSCTKEDLQVPQPAKANPANRGQSATASTQVVIWKPICCWNKVSGGSCSINYPDQLSFSWQIVAGPKSTPLVGVAYWESSGVLSQFASVTSVINDNGVKEGGISFTAMANRPYYLKLQCGNEVSWVPHINVMEACYITFPATAVTVRVTVY